MSFTVIPNSVEELKYRASLLAGKKISDIANELKIEVPGSLHRTKGWIGQVLECVLGATANNRAEPDFPALGVELKTIPLNSALMPSESTYVCTAPTTPDAMCWEESWICKKLSHVLWVPVEGALAKSLGDRVIGTPFLWKPSAEQEAVLKQDWEELTELLYFGGIEKLSAKYGTYLHIRPKAANSKVLIDVVNRDGYSVKVVPKGFYLRTTFTKQILSLMDYHGCRHSNEYC